MSTLDYPELAESIVDELLAADPRLASDAGDHRYDDRLPDLSADGVATRVAMLRDASAALSGVDTDGLSLADQVDHEQLLSQVERLLFLLTEVREHEWNPLVHNPGSLLHALIARPYAPVEQRLEALAGRLRAIPDALGVARSTLRDCPRIHLETAAGQFRGTAALVSDELPALGREAPSAWSTVEPDVIAAVAALESFAGWLDEQAAGAEPGRDPRLGRPRWEAKLWHTLDTELTAAEVNRLAWENLDRVSAEIREAAAEFVGGRAPGHAQVRRGAGSDDDAVRGALQRLADQHPDDTSIVELAQTTLDEATAFVRAAELVSLVDDPCVIQTMPEFARGVAVAYCDPPGPLEGDGLPTFYCIAPTPAGWSGERVESFYREYNNHMVRDLTVHEAMPGHFLQLAHARRYSGSTRVRAVVRSGPFVEGWAVYAERLMAENGFGGLPVRLQQLKMQLRMTINAIIDQAVHCDGMTEGEAMALMTRRGFQEEGEAAGKWRRALLTATQLSTYFVGYQEVAAIAAARPSGVDPRAWHDQMLAHGCPSPRHLRTLLLDGR
jgi:uncharacterized protein (DUF885 family)